MTTQAGTGCASRSRRPGGASRLRSSSDGCETALLEAMSGSVYSPARSNRSATEMPSPAATLSSVSTVRLNSPRSIAP